MPRAENAETWRAPVSFARHSAYNPAMVGPKATVGGKIEVDASKRFVDAWHRAEKGEAVRERHLAFESWDALARTLTNKRMEILSEEMGSE